MINKIEKVKGSAGAIIKPRKKFRVPVGKNVIRGDNDLSLP